MNLHTVINGRWMISPQMLDVIQDIYLRHANNEKLTKAEITKIIGGNIETEDRSFVVTTNGTALISVQGVIAKKMNILHDVSGGASSELIHKQLNEAFNSAEVKSIILDIDSPGGTVDGIFELADFVFENRNTKPIISHSDGMMTSAAFLLGAATNMITTSGQLVQVGGIGVIAKHVDISRAEEMVGQKTTVLHSGKFKAIGNPHEPLSLEDRAMLQDQLDFMYSHFVTTIAKFRGVSVETVLTEMAEGRTFMGDNAIKAGLVDRISPIDNLILDMPNLGSHTDKDKKRVNVFVRSNTNTNHLKEVSDMEIMSVEDLKKNCSEEVFKVIAGTLSDEGVVEFKASNEYLVLQEKANSVAGETSASESVMIAKLKSEAEETKTKLKENDRKFFAIQMSANKSKSDKIFGDLVGEADYSEMVQNKILDNKPDFEKHLNDEGNLKTDTYTEACKKEVESWAGITDNADQTVDVGGEQEAVAAGAEKSMYSSDDDRF